MAEERPIARSAEVFASVSMDERGTSARSAEVLASVSMDDRGANARSAEVLASASMVYTSDTARLRSAVPLLAIRESVSFDQDTLEQAPV